MSIIMKKRSLLFLINPKSGIHSKRYVPQLIDTYLNKDLYDYAIAETQYIAHACELTKSAVQQGVDAVVAVGGDGTVNEVARALVGTDTALGIIPCGSGNGFARHLGIPMDIKSAIEFINRSVTVPVDYGKINGIPFFCTCGMGFDAIVSRSFAEGKRRGFIGYINKAFHDLVMYKPEVYAIEAEQGYEINKAFLSACGNAAQYGNNVYIAPQASMKDGLLSVTILEPFSMVDIPILVGQVLSNTIDQNSHIKTLNTKWLKIRRKKPGIVHFDGEPVEMGTELFVEAVPNGMKVLAVRDWDGLYQPVPIYKQLFALFSGSFPMGIPDAFISLPWQMGDKKQAAAKTAEVPSEKPKKAPVKKQAAADKKPKSTLKNSLKSRLDKK